MKSAPRIGTSSELRLNELIARGLHRRAVIRVENFARQASRKAQ